MGYGDRHRYWYAQMRYRIILECYSGLDKRDQKCSMSGVQVPIILGAVFGAIAIPEYYCAECLGPMHQRGRLHALGEGQHESLPETSGSGPS